MAGNAANPPYIRRIGIETAQCRGSKRGGGGMAFMHFYCADHQREIDGGFDLDVDALRRLRREPVHVYCPLCSMTHRYLLADAVEATFDRRELRVRAEARG